MKVLCTCLLLASYTFTTQLWASNTGKIEAMHMPAWIKHSNGQKEPLTPDLIIQSGDQIITGKASRLTIRLKEGSHLKLGENTEINFSHLQSVAAEQGVFATTINVIKGTFRFSATALGINKKRDIRIKLGAITADITGTDIWGQKTAVDDLLCLFEGSVTAHRDGEPEFTMSDPFSYYLVAANKPAELVKTAPQNQLAQWAAQTELLDGGGVITSDGKWHVYLMSLTSLEAVDATTKQLAASGYATNVEKFVSLGRLWYRVRVSGFKTYDDAKIFSAIMSGIESIKHPWIGKS